MMEAKYVAVVHATKEAIWLGAFTGEFTTPPAIPTIVHCDNHSTIVLSKDRQHYGPNILLSTSILLV